VHLSYYMPIKVRFSVSVSCATSLNFNTIAQSSQNIVLWFWKFLFEIFFVNNLIKTINWKHCLSSPFMPSKYRNYFPKKINIKIWLLYSEV
jgi:hypothetical protein